MNERSAKPKSGPRESFRTRVSARPSEGVEELVSSQRRGGWSWSGRMHTLLFFFFLDGGRGEGGGRGQGQLRWLRGKGDGEGG